MNVQAPPTTPAPGTARDSAASGDAPAEQRPMPALTRQDFAHSPLLVFYEVTRACDLACVHCRAEAQKAAHPDELSSRDALRLIDQLATFPRPPLIVFTGGDPLKRADVFDLVDRAAARGMATAMTPSATPLVTREALVRLRAAGLHRLAVSLDGPDATSHDDFRRTAGSFARTMEIIRDAAQIGLPVQINTTVSKHNVHKIDAIAELLRGMDIVLWSVFFLVPTGRATDAQRLDAVETERVFRKLYDHSKNQPYAIKTTEAPHYRRFAMQEGKRRGQAGHGHNHAPSTSGGSREKTAKPPATLGTNDGKGVMFISHSGEMFPSGFLPICCGKFPLDNVVRVYQEARLFVALRDGDQFGGKCGICEFRQICGGSRARSFAVTGDPLAAEPDCAYVPKDRE